MDYDDRFSLLRPITITKGWKEPGSRLVYKTNKHSAPLDNTVAWIIRNMSPKLNYVTFHAESILSNTKYINSYHHIYILRASHRNAGFLCETSVGLLERCSSKIFTSLISGLRTRFVEMRKPWSMFHGSGVFSSDGSNRTANSVFGIWCCFWNTPYKSHHI